METRKSESTVRIPQRNSVAPLTTVQGINESIKLYLKRVTLNNKKQINLWPSINIVTMKKPIIINNLIKI